ncbi:MAG: DUF58 domain-containing protein [Candidatus Cloacimonetes bacterium]|jgi:uncharacterized protein (DUF58 family)|nr:DUF58 domain-containing protein [Candidatus Cloacimonadota bacterium]OQB07841.1 MAG: hypothetical protein BWY18_00183 [Candidatus Cloacimonetes bacterium ADurb.Bin211]HOD59256.1 DUF58 domain-containing protein [Candidatus Syntrophosphaera sp.]HQM79130.1 DUF58 domain-containing protein [Candidatus Syntrophosphaera sp.]
MNQPLLTDETAAKLRRFQLLAKTTVEGFLVGLHKSPYHGFSVEFSDHREYNIGDPIKNIDWKIVAKTDRYYVKRFEEETNLRCYILLDHSRSMFYGSGENTKIDYACQLAASLSWLMIGQKDAAGLVTFNDEITNLLPPKAYRGYLPQIFRILAELEPKDSTRLLQNLHKIADTIRKRSLIILISDLLDEPDNIMDGLKHFKSHHHEVLVFHITDIQEDNFKFHGETEFLDSETQEKITVNPWQIRPDYLQNYQEHIQKLKAGCHQYQIEYNPVSTATPIEDLLLKYLLMRRKG